MGNVSDERVYIGQSGEQGTFKPKNVDKNGNYLRDSNGNMKSKERSDTPGTWRVFKDGSVKESYEGDWKPNGNPSLIEKLIYKIE